jgi:hypothetical protein
MADAILYYHLKNEFPIECTASRDGKVSSLTGDGWKIYNADSFAISISDEPTSILDELQASSEFFQGKTYKSKSIYSTLLGKNNISERDHRMGGSKNSAPIVFTREADLLYKNVKEFDVNSAYASVLLGELPIGEVYDSPSTRAGYEHYTIAHVHALRNTGIAILPEDYPFEIKRVVCLTASMLELLYDLYTVKSIKIIAQKNVKLERLQNVKDIMRWVEIKEANDTERGNKLIRALAKRILTIYYGIFSQWSTEKIEAVPYYDKVNDVVMYMPNFSERVPSGSKLVQDYIVSQCAAEIVDVIKRNGSQCVHASTDSIHLLRRDGALPKSNLIGDWREEEVYQEIKYGDNGRWLAIDSSGELRYNLRGDSVSRSPMVTPENVRTGSSLGWIGQFPEPVPGGRKMTHYEVRF